MHVNPRRTVLRSLLVGAACACVLAPAQVGASPLFELVGAEDAGFAGRALPSGARAAYFNPALLLEAEPGATVGLFALIERLDVRLGARASVAECEDGACDVPEVNGAGPESFRHEDGSTLERPALPTAWLQDGLDDGEDVVLRARPRQGAPTGDDERAYLALGFVQEPIRERLSWGVSALLPLSDFMRANAFYTDEREQFFSNSLHHELYEDRLKAAGLAFGVGVQVIDQLSIGASLTLGIASAAQAPVYVSNLGDLDALLIDSEVGVALSLAPHFGVAVTPLSWLRLTATAHSPQSTGIETGFSYVIATGVEQRAAQAFELGYLPWIFGLGAELELGAPASAQWTVAASGTYALWSDYRDRHAERPRAPHAWSDVASVALTARCRVQSLAGFASATFAPSPVPSQTGRSNYVDSDRLAGSLGGSYDFPLLGAVATVGVEAQLHRLLPRSTRKRSGDGAGLVRDEVPDDAVGGTPRGPIEGREGLQTNNPGFPSFASEGVLLGGGARFSLAY